MNAWKVVDHTKDMNVLQSTWAFKLKHFPDGFIKKFKAWFCAREDQHIQGIDFFETYAPVAQWTTIHLMLILEVLLELNQNKATLLQHFLMPSWKIDNMYLWRCL